ncbi:MAG: hypothetical protein H7343_02765 [Undibacterium sp.]|nr:hypothetical protein [Opitutaceae bacterium]
MKFFPTRSIVPVTSLAFVTSLTTTSSVRAAEATPPPPTLPTAPAIDPLTSFLKPRTSAVTVDFPGGSVAQLVAQLRQSDGTTFNLIGEKSFQEAILPKFTLSNTDLSSMALALNTLLRPSGLTINLSGNNIFVLTKSPFTPSSFQPAPPTFQAYQLSAYLSTVALDDITDAINTAWTANPAHEAKALTFKFHPATKILFVYGPTEAIAMATQIIPQLNPSATARAQLNYYATLPQILPPADRSTHFRRPRSRASPA